MSEVEKIIILAPFCEKSHSKISEGGSPSLCEPWTLLLAMYSFLLLNVGNWNEILHYVNNCILTLALHTCYNSIEEDGREARHN